MHAVGLEKGLSCQGCGKVTRGILCITMNTVYNICNWQEGSWHCWLNSTVGYLIAYKLIGISIKQVKRTAASFPIQEIHSQRLQKSTLSTHSCIKVEKRVRKLI